MANYSYTSRAPRDPKDWLECLRIVTPVSSASSEYNEIHFTQPKKAVASAMTMPHVTFERDGVTTHWYLKPGDGKWVAQLGGKNTDSALAGEGTIAQNVADDAVALNYINPPAARVLEDEDGFKTAESRGGRRNRVKKSWK
jgi:hypothetical protein